MRSVEIEGSVLAAIGRNLKNAEGSEPTGKRIGEVAEEIKCVDAGVRHVAYAISNFRSLMPYL